MSEFQLIRDIDNFVEREFEEGRGLPDFWDELDTSSRLAEYLAELGYERV